MNYLDPILSLFDADYETIDIDAPIQVPGRSSVPEPSAEQVAMLSDMGFTSAQARKALRETVGDTMDGGPRLANLLPLGRQCRARGRMALLARR